MGESNSSTEAQLLHLVPASTEAPQFDSCRMLARISARLLATLLECTSSQCVRLNSGSAGLTHALQKAWLEKLVALHSNTSSQQQVSKLFGDQQAGSRRRGGALPPFNYHRVNLGVYSIISAVHKRVGAMLQTFEFSEEPGVHALLSDHRQMLSKVVV